MGRSHHTTAPSPPDPRARDTQDTFFVDVEKLLLRTHTSNVQIRSMERVKPPVKVLSCGRVRLTFLYGSLFFAAGLVLVAATYLLVAKRLEGMQVPFKPE